MEYKEHTSHPGFGWIEPIMDQDDPLISRDIAERIIETFDAMRNGLLAADQLMNESHGVDGLHLNGNIATWDSLRKGGDFQEWLSDFDDAVRLVNSDA